MEKSYDPNNEETENEEFSNSPNETEDMLVDFDTSYESIAIIDDDVDNKPLLDEDEEDSDYIENEFKNDEEDNQEECVDEKISSEKILTAPSQVALNKLLKPNNLLVSSNSKTVVTEFEKINPKDAFHQLSLLQKAMGQKCFILNYIEDKEFKDINLDDLLNLDDFKEDQYETEKLNKSIKDLIANESLDNDDETIRKLYKLRSIESLIEDSIAYEKYGAEYENFKKAVKHEIDKYRNDLLAYNDMRDSVAYQEKEMNFVEKTDECIAEKKSLINYFNNKLQFLSLILGREEKEVVDSEETLYFIETSINEIKLSLEKEKNESDTLKLSLEKEKNESDTLKLSLEKEKIFNDELKLQLENIDNKPTQNEDDLEELAEKEATIFEQEKDIEKLTNTITDLKVKITDLIANARREDESYAKPIADIGEDVSTEELDTEESVKDDVVIEDKEEAFQDDGDYEVVEDKEDVANNPKEEKKKLPKWLIVIISVLLSLGVAWYVLVFLFADEVQVIPPVAQTQQQRVISPVTPIRPVAQTQQQRVISPVTPIRPVAIKKDITPSYDYEKSITLEEFKMQKFDIYTTNFKKIRINGKDFHSGDVVNGIKFIKADSSGEMLFIKGNKPIYIKMQN